MQSGTPSLSQSKLSLNWLPDEAERQTRLREQRGKMGSWNPHLLPSVGFSSFLLDQWRVPCGRTLHSNPYSELPDGENDPDLGHRRGLTWWEWERQRSGKLAQRLLSLNLRKIGPMCFRGQVGIKQSLGKGSGGWGGTCSDNRFGTQGVGASEFRLECGRQKFSDSQMSGASVRKETVKIIKNSNGKILINGSETP